MAKLVRRSLLTAWLYFMSLSRIALISAAALASIIPASADAQMFGRRANTAAATVVNEIPRCTQSLGTVTIEETQNTMFRQMELGHSTEVLRYMIRESGCFQLIERGAGMSLVERERSLGAAGRIRTADFVLAAELNNHIEVDNSDRGSSLLGTLTSVGARAVAASMSGENPAVANLVTRGAGMLNSTNDNKTEAPLNQRTLRAIEDLAKDIKKGDQDAQLVFSLTSVPLAETVSYNRSQANRKDVRSLRIRDNHYEGRIGSGFESEDVGKIITLAMVRGFADMVIDLGGTGNEIPAVVVANREAIEAANAQIRREEERAERAERAELELQAARVQRAEQARQDEADRIRAEIRAEERARIQREMDADQTKADTNL